MDCRDGILLTAGQGAFTHPESTRLANTCKQVLRELVGTLRKGALLHVILAKWYHETGPPPMVTSSSESAGDLEGDESDSDDSDGFDMWLWNGLPRGQARMESAEDGGRQLSHKRHYVGSA